MYTIKPEGCKVPIKIWSTEGSIESEAVQQLHNAASLPFVFHHVAAMPDCHKGYGVTIGSIVATQNVVIPFAVGSDIGCGMLAVKTSLTEITTERIKEIMTLIRKWVPVGFEHQSEAQDENFMPKYEGNYPAMDYPIVCKEYNSALKQLGSLGSGNHFLEIQRGSDGHIWFMIHSGSRNIGLKVATHYNELAKELNARWHSAVDPKWDLAFLPLETNEAKTYLREMNFCLEFAYANRKLMAKRIKEAFETVPCLICNGQGGKGGKKCEACDGTGIEGTGASGAWHNVEFLEEINIHHNYARLENHFGHNVMIHRKGATLASDSTMGLIPGSQGTCSYVVRGKGNPDSFMSCSHGAGRKMGRKEACRSLNLQDEIKRLNDKGIVHAIRRKEDLDEAAGAYKDIDQVMAEQADLVDIIVKLEPLAVIKG